jgi:hypothetical protein
LKDLKGLGDKMKPKKLNDTATKKAAPAKKEAPKKVMLL